MDEDLTSLTPIQKEGKQRPVITLTRGTLTNNYIDTFGESDDLENLKDRETTMIVDGLKVINPNYEIFLFYGYVFANAPGTFESEQEPAVGIKIHVALNPDDRTYREKLLKIAELCLEENLDEKATSFKVMTYSTHKETLTFDPDQARKTVTVYPNFLNGGKTNVAETVRLVAGLRKILDGHDKDSIAPGIFQEHKSGNGIYLRAGALTKRGKDHETVDKSAPFEEQVNGNLFSPETNAELFSIEIAKAIESGQL